MSHIVVAAAAAAAAAVAVDDVSNDYFVMTVNKFVVVADGLERLDDAVEAVMLATKMATVNRRLDIIVRRLTFPKSTRTHCLQKKYV